jgi:hypothetical protein
MLNKQPLGRPEAGQRDETREDIRNTTGKAWTQIQEYPYGRTEKNRKGFIIGQPTLMETSVYDNESF